MARVRTPSGTPRTLGLVLFGGALLSLAAAVGVRAWKGYGFGYLTRDPAATVGEAFVLGMISNLGVILWAVALGCCVVGALGLGEGPGEGPRATTPVARTYGLGGLLTALLLLDDAFMVHEEVLPSYLGLPGEALLVVEVAVLAVVLWSLFRCLDRFDAPFLGVSLVFFGVSLGFDRSWTGPWHYLVEDGSKFLGITGWCAFWMASLIGEMRRGSGAKPLARGGAPF